MSKEGSDRFGVASMSSRLERVAVRKPSAILRADAAEWHYRKVLNSERSLSQFSSFIALLDHFGVEVLWFDDEPDDAVWVEVDLPRFSLTLFERSFK